MNNTKELKHGIGETVYYAEFDGTYTDIKIGTVNDVHFNEYIGEYEFGIVWGNHRTGIRQSSVLSPCDYALIHHISRKQH